MKQYENFYFEKFEFNKETLDAKFYYNFDWELFFEEKVSFSDKNFSLRKNIDLNIVNNILFHIHIALWISYYKFYPTKKLILKTGKIDEFQISFWKKFYLNWLWEFFYRNQINPNWLLEFEYEEKRVFEKKDFEVSEKYLVPVWWWKDSIVSIELLKLFQKEIDLVTFAVQDNILYENTTKNAGVKRFFIKRELSQNIKEIIASWAYNWHVPITWMIAFVLELACYLYDYKYIILSNEASANFWNTIYHWVEINHQWSKSLDFEKDFSKYVLTYISGNVKYFSFLRPFYELKIAEIFSKIWKKYFTNFSSCNTNFKIFKKVGKNTYWCNNCPKCVFVYIILRAFLDKKDIISIFWKELYEEESLEKLFRELAWISWIKPFECVWTNEEVILAMKMAFEKWEGKVPFILEIFWNEIYSKMSDDDFKKLQEKLLKADFKENLIPQDLIKNIKNYA